MAGISADGHTLKRPYQKVTSVSSTAHQSTQELSKGLTYVFQHGTLKVISAYCLDIDQQHVYNSALQLQASCSGSACVTLTACVHSGVAASEVKRGVEFALQQRRLGRAVLVHCAHGHGRSAQVLIASMVMAGDAANIDAALSTLQATRPKCKLNRLQRSNLEEYLSSVDPPKH